MQFVNFFRYIYFYFLNLLGERLILETPTGPIMGSILKTATGKDIYSYRGIPYAQPPLGDLRFEPPQPIEPWKDVYDATRKHSGCVRPGILPLEKVSGVEDCLVLNVYTLLRPNETDTADLPVLVFIHGGGFTSGKSDTQIYNPGYFMEYPMVLVTLNYRLGPFGFISTEDSVAPGNNGLRDQIMALKWVQTNIHAFGGDPARVTLMGESAGATSVHLLMCSPLAKGLFSQAISQSGSAFSPVLRYSKTIAYRTKELSRILNCPTYSSQAMIECLRYKKPKKILKGMKKLYEWGIFPFPFTPRIDKEAREPVIPREPLDIYEDGEVQNVPWIVGVNQDEGIFWNANKLVSDVQLVSATPHMFSRISNIITGTAYENKTVDFTSLRKRYFKSNVIHKDSKEFDEYVGDSFFVTSVNYGQKMHSRIADTYAYLFSYQGRYSLAGFYSFPFNGRGASHGDELIYQFGPNYPFVGITPEDEDYKMVKAMTEIWFAFISTGKPLVLGEEFWPTFDNETKKYLDIGSTLKVKEEYKEEVVRLWQDAMGLPPA